VALRTFGLVSGAAAGFCSTATTTSASFDIRIGEAAWDSVCSVIAVESNYCVAMKITIVDSDEAEFQL